ncbi:uncharacterized protein B0H18DRAFT_1157309 [Fomitopsis serialis]|uniref:uncharacterized protein n=1 Tax=Fomitopsis serialis TaxID=139415 RepID=UPI0020082C45|nr:uncharacterized protein B0H18DRAFT_1157309 [Neoantrodia serialis]KAH9912465.1 hypothetical protein B0H18DRAFT_1157309 [Neoantrodia serialis]
MDRTPTPDNFNTIAEVDAAVEDVLQRGITVDIVSDLTSFEQPFLNRSDEFCRLLAMKYVSRQNSDVTRAKKEQYERNRARLHMEDSSALHFEGFRRAFGEINTGSDNAFGEDRVQSFLDLGCAPGGSSTWILQNNRNARGIGITLSPDAGGLRLQLDSPFLEQLQVRYEDLCKIASGGEAIEDTPATGFDLVVAHAAIMFRDDVRWTQSIALTYAQLLIAFQHIAQDGSLVISLRSRPLNWVVDIVRALDEAFTSVHAVNTMYQGRRPFVNVVCRGFRAGTDERNEYIRRLRLCVRYFETTSGSLVFDTSVRLDRHANVCLVVAGPVDAPNGGAANIPRLCGTRDEEIPEATYQYVLNLFTGVWQSKYAAIRHNCQKVFVRRNADRGRHKRTRAMMQAADNSSHTVMSAGSDENNGSYRTAGQQLGAARVFVSATN